MISVRSFACLWVALTALLLPNISWASTDAASKYVEGLANQTLTTISAKGISKQQKQTSLEKLFLDNVDIQWVGRFVLGTTWRQATDDQKKRYLTHYQAFIVRHYTSRFTDYTSGSFNITGAKSDGEGEFTVSMQIQPPEKNSTPILADYRVRKGAGGFKIFDIIVEGVSMITTQRSEFASVINQHGLDYLINQLDTKSKPQP